MENTWYPRTILD